METLQEIANQVDAETLVELFSNGEIEKYDSNPSDLYMNDDEKEEFHKLAKEGKKFKITWTDKKTEKMVNKGWTLLVEEYNYDNYNAILYK